MKFGMNILLLAAVFNFVSQYQYDSGLVFQNGTKQLYY